jgi:hypothetical protein
MADQREGEGGTSAAMGGKLKNDWLAKFYSECGREVTLAYTTLNQMKNWAVAVVAAFTSAVVALVGKSSQGLAIHPGIFVAAIVAYVLTLRFLIRSILCYINLVRWNTLQSSIIELTLRDHEPQETDRLSRRLDQNIADYYFQWLSPLDRRGQILSNLKLGFALLLAVPLFFVVAGAIILWDLPLVRGLSVFCIGDTLVEVSDFLRSHFFDTPAVKAARGKKQSVFPVPVSGPWYLVTWAVTLLVSLLVAFWPSLAVWLKGLAR